MIFYIILKYISNYYRTKIINIFNSEITYQYCKFVIQEINHTIKLQSGHLLKLNLNPMLYLN